jgi:hypothetical protein
MRSRIAVDSMVSKIDQTPLLMGSDASRSTSKAWPSERGAREGAPGDGGSGVGAEAGTGDGAEAGSGEATGSGEGLGSWAAAVTAKARMRMDRRTRDLKRPWAHGGAQEFMNLLWL